MLLTVALIVAALALREALSLLRLAGRPILMTEGVAWGVATVGVSGGRGFTWLWAAFAIGAGVVLIAALSKHNLTKAVAAWGVTAVAVAYVTLSLGAALLVRGGPDGVDWLLVAVLGTFATDTGAYAVGRAIGRHRMAPSISPSKTWEGAVGGLLAAVAATAALMGLLGGLTFTLWDVVLLGAAIGIMSQAGDLLESKLKRLAGVKESGSLIPGHGGLLDRLDSLVLIFPLIYYASQVWPV